MGGIGGVLQNTFCFAGASCKEISRMEGRGAPMIFAAVFTVRWRVLRSAAQQFPYQTVMQLVSTLSMVPLVEGGEDGWRETCSFSRRERV